MYFSEYRKNIISKFVKNYTRMLGVVVLAFNTSTLETAAVSSKISLVYMSYMVRPGLDK